MSIAFITGASSGIGQALARQYLSNGWTVALVARRGDVVRAWCDQQAWPQSAYRIYEADVRDVQAIAGVGHQCMTELGVPNVVIAAAGVSIGIDTAYVEDLEVMRLTYETNNIGMAATFQPFIHAMCERGSGRLVGVASVGGIRGLAGHGAYCASKAAVISYCESLRLEMREATGPQGVRVVTLVPGYVATPLTARNRYGMPFLLTADEFASRACKVIARGASYRVIPWQMALVAKVMRLLPNALYDRLFSGRKRKRRLHE